MKCYPGRVLIAVSLAVLGLPLLAADEKPSDWAQFRGPGGQGVSPDKGVPATWSGTENVLWKVALPGAGTSSPVVVGPRVFLTCFSGYNVPGEPGDMQRLRLHVLCHDRDGKQLWSKEIEPSLPELERMREGHGYASGTPACDGERLYVAFGKSGVFAFDLDGKQLWRAGIGTRLDPHGWGSAASPVVVGDLVVVNASVESDSLVALDRKTGKEVWRAEGIKESWNTPVPVSVAGKTELVVAVPGKILGFDPATGARLWSCDSGIASYMVPTVAAGDGVVYVIGGRTNGSLAVRAGGRGDVTRTHRLWTSTKGSNVSSPVLHDGHLYWMHDNQGTALCVEAKTGKVVYEQRLPRANQCYASAVLVDGKVYNVDRSGRTWVVAAKPEYELVAMNDLGERSTFNATPAVAGGRLYLRSDRTLYCIGKK